MGSFAKFPLIVLGCFFWVASLQSEVVGETNHEYEFVGYHLLASYTGCDAEALENVEALSQAMKDGVVASGATLLNSVSHIFPPSGLTMVMLLSESHASIHTYPEHQACFVDFFTCGSSCSAEKFEAVLQSYLKPKNVQRRYIHRSGDGDVDVN